MLKTILTCQPNYSYVFTIVIEIPDRNTTMNGDFPKKDIWGKKGTITMGLTDILSSLN